VRLLVAEALVLVALLALLALGASPAFAGTLASVSWSVNNSQTGKTGVTYAFAFTTNTAGTIKSVTLTVPSGTAGTIAVGTVYGLGAGTVALATRTSTPSTIDSGTSGSVTFGSSSTTATVTVAQTLTFTNNTLSLSFVVDPTGPAASSSQAVTLTVQTNASAGYTLAASDTGLSRTGPAYTIADVTSGPGTGVGTFPSSGFGASATLMTGGTDGAAMASGLTGGKFVGYPSSAATFLSATGPTGTTADTLVLTNQVAVDYSVPAGTYTNTITYVVTPSF
jgi:hypothetical protein